MMDEESVHVLSLKDDVRCVVAVEARYLLAESGSQSKTNRWWHDIPCCIPGCFNNSSEDAGRKVSFYYKYIPRS